MKVIFNRGNQYAKNARLITNFDKEREPIYRKAINELGWDELYISKDAYWENGYKDDSMYALMYRGSEQINLSEFWRIFDRLKKLNLK